VKVEKKDGRLEDFDRGKISRGIVASGASQEVADAVAAEVETWASNAAVERNIATAEIRGKVLELLHAQDPAAATNFEQYQKPQV